MDCLGSHIRRPQSFSVEPYNGGAKFRYGDTLFARITPCLENGKTAYANTLDEDEIAFGSTEYIVLRAKPNISLPLFVYYLAISKIIREPAIKSMVGSSGRQRVNQTALEELEIPEYSFAEQRHIVNILGSLDDKIENNELLVEKLEELLVLKFDKALVKYPTKTGSLLEIANFVNGLAMQKFRPMGGETSIPVIKIKELGQGFADDNSERATANIKPAFIVNNGDVIFAWSGTLMVKLWVGGLGGLNQHLFKVTSSKYPKWFYYLWSKKHLQGFQSIAQGMATTMGHIKRSDLEKARVQIFDDIDFDSLDKELEPLLERIISSRIENQNLVKLKNAYLKKFFG